MRIVYVFFGTIATVLTGACLSSTDPSSSESGDTTGGGHPPLAGSGGTGGSSAICLGAPVGDVACPTCDDKNYCTVDTCVDGGCVHTAKITGDCPIFDGGTVVDIGVCHAGCCQ